MKIKPGPGFRSYSVGRGLVPSVTEILKVIEGPKGTHVRQLVGKEKAEKLLRDAAAFGTKVHAAAQLVAVNRDPEVKAEIRPFAQAVRRFLNNNVAEVLATELELVSLQQGFGGTADLYCRLADGACAIVDLKTTSQLTREHGLQLAGYALLAREHGFTVNRRIAVRIKKEKPGAYYVRSYGDHAQDVEAFRACKTLWWWRHKSVRRAA